jgi:GGDEF domain-containing protein
VKPQNEVVCALFDVTGMQALNDQRGYEFGNRLLDDIEVKLKLVFTSAEVRHLDGDEFMVMQAKGDHVAVERKAQAVVQAIDDEFGVALSCGFGIGASISEAERAATFDLFQNRRCSRRSIRPVRGKYL